MRETPVQWGSRALQLSGDAGRFIKILLEIVEWQTVDAMRQTTNNTSLMLSVACVQQSVVVRSKYTYVMKRYGTGTYLEVVLRVKICVRNYLNLSLALLGSREKSPIRNAAAASYFVLDTRREGIKAPNQIISLQWSNT